MAPSVVEEDVMSVYNVAVVGRIEEVQERFYAISVERRFRNPAVTAILDSARRQLFTAPAGAGEAACA